MIAAFVAIDEILQEERNVALLQIATPAQLLGDIAGNVLRPFFGGVEGDDADRAFILALEQVENDRLEFAALSSASRQTGPSRPRSSITR